MVSALYILHWPDYDVEYLRCELIMHRSYQNDVPDAHLIVSRFQDLYRNLKRHERTPVLCDRGVHYIYLWGDNDIVFVAAARSNVNVMLTVTFLHQFHSILHHYFVKSRTTQNTATHKFQLAIPESTLTRDQIVDNFSLVYELLDECIDFGVVQLTDYNILKEYIKTEINSGKNADHVLGQDTSDSELDSEGNAKPANGKTDKKIKHKHITSTHNHAVKSDVVDHRADNVINSSIVRTQALAISWRPKGIFYLKNEIYIDLVEECEFIFDLDTQTVKLNEIRGVCQIKSYLSGMPVCKLGLNEKYISQVEYDDDIEEETPLPRAGNMISDEADIDEGTPDPEKQVKRLKVPINNVQFHQCIELSSIYEENLILFTPPDGEFQLLTYTVDQQRRKDKQPLITVAPKFRIDKRARKLQILCSLTTTFKKRLHCRNLVVTIPVNPGIFFFSDHHTDNFRFKAELGDVRFKVDTSEVLWAIDDLPGSKRTVRMMAEISLDDCNHIEPDLIRAALAHVNQGNSARQENEESALSELDKYYGVHGVSKSAFGELQQRARENFASNDIRVQFELPLMTYSGLRIIYLRVDEEVLKYTCFPWVRYLTQSSVQSQKVRNGYRFWVGPKCFEIV